MLLAMTDEILTLPWAAKLILGRIFIKFCTWDLLVNVWNCLKSLFDIYCQREDMANFDILQGKLEPPP